MRRKSYQNRNLIKRLKVRHLHHKIPATGYTQLPEIALKLHLPYVQSSRITYVVEDPELFKVLLAAPETIVTSPAVQGRLAPYLVGTTAGVATGEEE